MDFKADYKTIYNIGDQFQKEVENIELKRLKLLKIIEELKDYWDGDDYREFRENAKVYIDNLRIKVDELQYAAGFLKYASGKYSKNDDQWVEKIKKYREDNKWDLTEKLKS